ncbi:MAG: hypothetical protein ACO26G_01290 [Rickettsiales bacterium]
MYSQLNFNINKLIIKNIKPKLLIIASASFFINLITIICSFYSMQIFDKVLSSSSLATLFYLTSLAIIMVFASKILGIFRVNALIQINKIIYNILFKKIKLLDNQNLEHQLLKQLNKISEISLNNGLFCLIDVVFSAGYLLVIFLINPWLALFSLIALGILCLVEKYFNKKIKILNAKQNKLKDIDLIANSVAKKYQSLATQIDDNQYFRYIVNFQKILKYRNLSFETNAFFLTIFKNLRLIIQILTTAFSAVLIIKNQISIGSMIAVSILISKFLEPFFAIENNLKNLQELKQNYQNLLFKISQDLEIEKIDFNLKKFSQITFNKILVQNPINAMQSIEIENLEIAKEELIALYCESNFQKNLIPNLLLNHINPVVGSIKINGYDLARINQNQITKMLSIIDDNQVNLAGKVGDFIENFDDLNVDLKEILIELRIADEYKNLTSQNFFFEDISITQKKLLLFIKKINLTNKIIFLESPFGSAYNERLLKLIRLYSKKNQITLIFFNPALHLREYFDKIIIAKNGYINSYYTNEIKSYDKK